MIQDGFSKMRFPLRVRGWYGRVLAVCAAAVCGMGAMHAGPSVQQRHAGRDIIRSQGWASVPYWKQLRDQADSLMGWGLYERAATAYGFADAVLIRLKGKAHRDTLRNQVDLADALLRLGKPEGEKNLHEAYELQREHLERDDPDILRTRHLLASLMIARWQLKEAEGELKAIIALRAKRLGPGHSDTLTSRENLAYVYSMMLDHAGAEQQLRLVLAADMLTFGPLSLQTCATRERLGHCFQKQSKFDEALVEFRAVLMIVLDEFGPRHPLTFRAQHQLASIMYDQGKHEHAEADYRALAKSLEEFLGPGSPEIIPFREGIADCLSARGKLAEAEQELREAIRLCAEAPGESSPLMQELRANLAHVLIEERKLDEAERLFNAVLDQRTKALGSNHPIVLDSMNDLAACKLARGDLRGAELYLRSLVELREELQGANHPATWFSRIYLADTLRQSGNAVEALPLFEGVWAYNSTTLGPLHPYTLKAVNNVAITLSQMGKEEESFTLQSNLLNQRIRVMGPDHPDTLKSRINLAHNFADARRYDQAERHYIEALLTAEKTLGVTHMLTLKSLLGYGDMLAYVRRSAEAEAVARQGIRSTAGFSEDDFDALQFKSLLGLSLILQNRSKDAEAIAADVELLQQRRQGMLDWNQLLQVNMVVWVHLANGKQSQAKELLSRILAQLRAMGVSESDVPFVRMRCLEALLMYVSGNASEGARIMDGLEPRLKKFFYDDEPIRVFSSSLRRKGPLPIPALMHAVQFSRAKPQNLLTEQEERAGIFFPPNTTPAQRARVYEAFDQAQTLADKREHEKALEKFGTYLSVVTEVAGAGTISSLTAHLCLAREAVLCNRNDIAREHAKHAAEVLKKLGEDRGMAAAQFLQKTVAVQTERGNVQAAATLGDLLLQASTASLGPAHHATLQLEKILLELKIMANSPDTGEALQALIKRASERYGEEDGNSLLLKVKLLRWHLSKADYHAAHTLAFRIETPVKRLFGEYSEFALVVREGLAAALEGQGLRSLAVTETKLILADSERIAGAEAVATVMTRHRLALMLSRAGQFEEALQLHLINQKILNHPGTEKHPVMIEVKANLAYAYLSLKRNSEAVEAARQAHEGALAIMGRNSPMAEMTKNILEAAKSHAAASPQ